MNALTRLIKLPNMATAHAFLSDHQNSSIGVRPEHCREFLRLYQDPKRDATATEIADTVLGKPGTQGSARASTMALLMALGLFCPVVLPFAYAALSSLAVVLDVLQGAL